MKQALVLITSLGLAELAARVVRVATGFETTAVVLPLWLAIALIGVGAVGVCYLDRFRRGRAPY